MPQFEVDCGNLLLCETSIVSGERRTEEDLLASATVAAKRLFGELLALPKQLRRGKHESATQLTELPAPLMMLPREKAPPKPKPLTAWQKFAVKKGIALSRKKTNRVWNEDRQEWVDKWGKRARDDERKYDWLREVKPGYVATEEGGDPFLDDRRKKSARLEKQKKNEERNKKRAEFVDRSGTEVKHLHATTKKITTASMGKFDRQAKKP